MKTRTGEVVAKNVTKISREHLRKELARTW